MSTNALNTPWHYAAYEPEFRQFGVYVADCNGRRVVQLEGAIEQKEGLIKKARLIAAAPEFPEELKKAGEIFIVMLNLMSTEAQFEAAKILEQRGISPDGMTRRNEREALIAKAEGRS